MHSVNSKRLYLRGLHQDVTEEELYKFLSCYGKITEVKLLPNYAFVQFESEMVASVVLETYQNQPLLGKVVVVEYSHPLRKDMRSASNSTSNTDSHRDSSCKVWNRHCVLVSSIPPGVCWQELKDFGRLSGSMVAFCNLDRNQRGRGFIEYFTREDAVTAAQVLNNKRLGGRPVRVVAHEAVRKSVHERLHCVSLRTQECHKSPAKNSGMRRHEEAENIAQSWPRYYLTQPPDMQQHYSTHSKRDSPDDSIPYEQAIPRNNGERTSSWASRCSYHPYRPYEYLDDFYNQGYPGNRGNHNAAYRVDRGAISHHRYR